MYEEISEHLQQIKAIVTGHQYDSTIAVHLITSHIHEIEKLLGKLQEGEQ